MKENSTTAKAATDKKQQEKNKKVANHVQLVILEKANTLDLAFFVTSSRMYERGIFLTIY